jgi:predicted HicB family RNase H-like nuclease
MGPGWDQKCYGRIVAEKEQKVDLHVRLDEDVHADVKGYAQNARRSLNNAVTYLLRVGLSTETQQPRDDNRT